MAPKSQSSNDYVPSHGIREDVFKHQLKHVFGSDATYRKSKTRDGWIIEDGKCVTQDRIEQLQLSTETVVEVTRQRKLAAEAQRSSARQTPLTSGIPAYPNPRRTEKKSEDRLQDAADNNEEYDSDDVIGHAKGSKDEPQDHLGASAPDRHSTLPAAGPRTSSLPIRQFVGGQQGLTQEPLGLEPLSNVSYLQPRTDGYSPRSSSLGVNSIPVAGPQTTTRHHASRDIASSYQNTIPSYQNSYGDLAPIAQQAIHGTTDPSLAARQTGRIYEQNDFRDFLEWQQYKKEKAEFQARSARRRDQESEEEEDYLEEEKPDRHKDSALKSAKKPSSGKQDAGRTSTSKSSKHSNYEMATRRSSRSSKKYHDDDRIPRSEREEIIYEDDDEKRSRRHRGNTDGSTVVSNTGRRREKGYVADPGRRH